MSFRSTAARWTAVLAVPAVALATATPAFAADDTYTVPLHQPLPIKATDDGVEPGECPDTIPADKDGWHFVLPTNDTVFVKLTVTFQPGGQQVITSFKAPTDKHAYVASPVGATLTSAVAEVKGGEVKWFNLSHTCPGTPPTSAPPTSKPPTTTPATSKPPTDGTKTPPPATSSTPPGTTSSAPASTDSAAPTPSTPANTDGDGGSLAQTGAIAVGGILAAAAALIGGGYLLRRRLGGNHAA